MREYSKEIRKFIDIMYNSRRNDETEVSFRDIIGMMIGGYGDSEVREKLNAFNALEIMDYYMRDEKFKEFYKEIENQAIGCLKRYLSNNTGFQAMVPCILLSADYSSEKFYAASSLLIESYVARRKYSSDKMFYATGDSSEWIPCIIEWLQSFSLDTLYAISINYVALKVDQRVDEAIRTRISDEHRFLKSISDCDFKGDEKNTFKRKLLATDLTDSEINEFMRMTAQSMDAKFNQLGEFTKLKLITDLNNGKVFFEDIKNMEHFGFRQVETCPNEYSYVFDIYGCNYSKEQGFV